MASGNNKYDGKERRAEQRRVDQDRRNIIRFEDILGRRSGVERRLTTQVAATG